MLHLAATTSQASAIQNGITATAGAASGTVLLDSQLCFFNDLYGWARIAVPALIDRPPPDRTHGPTAEGMTLEVNCTPSATSVWCVWIITGESCVRCPIYNLRKVINNHCKHESSLSVVPCCGGFFVGLVERFTMLGRKK